MSDSPELQTHFPWQRFSMTLIFDATLIGIMHLFVHWLYYFATLDPHTTSGAAAITALSAGAGILFICFSAVNIWFISGSVRTVESMFKFNAAALAQTALNSVTEQISESRKLDEHVVSEVKNENLREFQD